MNRKEFHCRCKSGISIVFLLIFLSCLSPTHAAEQADGIFTATQHLDYAQREQAYEEMNLNRKDWHDGKMISEHPYAVVTYLNEHDTEKIAIVRVWTGFMARDGNNLLTFWDELWLGPDGKVIKHATDNDAVLVGYFAAVDQDVFQTKEQLGIMPRRVVIPTDPEAAGKKLPKVPSDGAFNLYDIHFVQAPFLSQSPQTVTIVGTSPVKDLEAAAPSDSSLHWAKEYIIDLLSKGIIKGYGDGTIRPDHSLTRAEFASLLAGALSKMPNGSLSFSFAGKPEKPYIDLKGHWANSAVQELVNIGIIRNTSGDAKFQPDKKITRIDMIIWVSAVLKSLGWSENSPHLPYVDAGSLSLEEKKALQMAVDTDLIAHQPDIAFRPQDSLTRAESFKVVSNLLKKQ